MIKAKRFRVKWQDLYPFKSNSLEEVYHYLFQIDGKSGTTKIREMEVECVVDDIIIPAIDVYECFCEGECPGDLQFF